MHEGPRWQIQYNEERPHDAVGDMIREHFEIIPPVFPRNSTHFYCPMGIFARDDCYSLPTDSAEESKVLL